IATSPDGRHAYVTGFSSNDVSVIDVTSASVVGTVAVGNGAYGVTVGRDSRRVYVSNANGNSVSVIDAATRTLIATVPVGTRPEGIDVSADGSQVYVVNRDSFYISRISTASNMVVGTIHVNGGAPFAMGRFVSMGGRAPEFTSSAAQNGLFGEPYSHTLTVSGAPASSFALVSGELPPGLTLNGAVISGTPTAVGAAVNALVRASNGVGTPVTQALSIAIAATVPGAPTITDVGAGDGTVTVSFAPPANDGGTPITQFNAFCGGFAGSSLSSPISISGLPNGVPVTCTVNAVNAIGGGVASSPSAPVTPGVAPVFTSAALPDGTYGTPYQRTLTATGSPAPTFALASGSLPTGLSLDASSGVVSGTPSSVGTFSGTISASNGIGSAATQAFAITIVAGLPDAPTAVVATRGNAQVSVAFLAPTGTGGVALSGFRASCGSQLANAVASPITVTGLVNGTPVTCTVVAINTAGNSAPSAPSNSVTPATLPDAPGMFEATAGNGSATLRFAPPVSDGGATVEDYTATCLPGGASVTGSASPLTVSGLANGTLYDCVVVARNAVGSGPDSAPSSVLPAAVTSADVSVTMSNGTRFVTGGAPTTYVISISNPGPAGVARVRVQDVLDADFGVPSWSCSGQGGAVCAASGIGGPIDERVDLPLGSSVTILLTATVAALPETPVSNLVSVTLPAPFTDPNLQNNVATDGPDIRGLFRDGLE
ncbi:MAG TPA: putative Ig domain-containing protein, partial [Xanthomonadales bacterium]|nr:putative Ig domain-containing protein [Xanthomonadales bacterium]